MIIPASALKVSAGENLRHTMMLLIVRFSLPSRCLWRPICALDPTLRRYRRRVSPGSPPDRPWSGTRRPPLTAFASAAGHLRARLRGSSDDGGLRSFAGLLAGRRGDVFDLAHVLLLHDAHR